MDMDSAGESQVFRMDPGDVLVLLSDGIYEYENKQGVQFGEDGIARLLKYHHRLPMVEMSKQILNATYEHGAGVSQQDDITLVLLRRLPEEN